jgi:hypothetical protein
LEYGPNDLHIIDDPIKVIQRNPLLYGGEQPRGARFAAAVVRDLINHGDLPVNIDILDGWWLITCQRDWLCGDGTDRSHYWRRMIPTPHIARESIRAEILLTAFSRGLITVAEGKITWIVQNAEISSALNDRIRQLIESKFSGRAVAFIAD